VAYAAPFFMARWKTSTHCQIDFSIMMGASMSKLIVILNLLLLAIFNTACTSAPANKYNPPEQQRSHSRDAQEELSTDIKR
jgi:predicted alpha/beta superfamily hydrolase